MHVTEEQCTCILYVHIYTGEYGDSHLLTVTNAKIESAVHSKLSLQRVVQHEKCMSLLLTEERQRTTVS